MANGIYTVVRTAQFVLFLLSFVVVYRIYREKNTVKQRALLLASICAVVNMYGYLEELGADQSAGSAWALRSQYVSWMLFAVIMLHLLSMLCEFEIKKWQTVLVWSINIIFVTLLYVDTYTGVLFRGFYLEDGPLAMRLRFQIMPLGYVYMAYMIIVTLAVLYIGTVVRHSRGCDGVITAIAVSAVLPTVAYILNAAGLTGGFDFAPLLMVGCCGLIYHFNKYHYFLDDGEIARETILNELGEGYIILDRERNVKAYNSIAAMLYPELEQPGDSEVIIELIYLHNHDILEHNGKICHVTISELKENSDLTGYVVWLYDCTDEYFYMKDLERLQEQASQSDQTRDLFLHHMTYGFGSPIYIIKNRADAICRDERTSDDVKELSLEVLEAGQKLEDMVEIMKEHFHGPKANSLNEREYETDDLIRELYSLVKERQQGRCQDVILSASPQLPTGWYGDKDCIAAVLRGILHCAGISAKISGIELNVASEMRYADTLLTLTLYLYDNGMTTGVMNRLSLMAAPKPDKAGDVDVTYIPYAYSKRMLLELRGTMECSVDLNRSKISVMIPQKVLDNTPYGPDADGGPQVYPHDSEEEEKRSDANKTILVVDDNLLYLKELEGWLRRLGIKTIMAKSGVECLRIFEKKHVDLVFMDQMMPGMDGTQTLQEIRRIERERDMEAVPVVLLTADDSVGARKRYLDLGFDDYVAKPLEAQQIEEQVARHMKQS